MAEEQQVYTVELYGGTGAAPVIGGLPRESSAVIGKLTLAANFDIPAFDFALTPIVEIDDNPDIQARVTGFLAHQRTKMRTEPRAADYPHDYISEPLSREEIDALLEAMPPWKTSDGSDNPNLASAEGKLRALLLRTKPEEAPK